MSHAAASRRTLHSMSGLSSSQGTTRDASPVSAAFWRVAFSMVGQCSAGTLRPSPFHWLTAPFVTCSREARADSEPMAFAARSMGCGVFMHEV